MLLLTPGADGKFACKVSRERVEIVLAARNIVGGIGVQKRKSIFCKRSRVNYAKPHTALTIIELRPLFKEVVVPGASVARTRSVQLRDQMKPQRQFVTSVMVFYVRTGTCKHTHNKTKHHSRRAAGGKLGNRRTHTHARPNYTFERARALVYSTR
jgi:hypothetical protein